LSKKYSCKKEAHIVAYKKEEAGKNTLMLFLCNLLMREAEAGKRHVFQTFFLLTSGR
jgi:hypothetical protein